MLKYGKNTQYETRKRVATIPVPESQTNFMVISRIAPIQEGQQEKIDVRRFYASKNGGDIRPSKNGVHIHLDMIEDVLSGIWTALTQKERKQCMNKILNIEEGQ